MHEVAKAVLALFPKPRVIKYVLGELGYGGDEAVHSEDIPEKAGEFAKVVKKHLRRLPHAFTAYLRPDEPLFVVCWTKAERKYYIEFPDLNSPEVVDD